MTHSRIVNTTRDEWRISPLTVTLPQAASPCATWGRPSPSASSSPSTRSSPPAARWPSPHRRPTRRNEFSCRTSGKEPRPSSGPPRPSSPSPATLHRLPWGRALYSRTGLCWSKLIGKASAGKEGLCLLGKAMITIEFTIKTIKLPNEDVSFVVFYRIYVIAKQFWGLFISFEY